VRVPGASPGGPTIIKRGEMDKKNQLYLFIAAGLLLLYFSYRLVFPFIVPVIASIIVALLIYPAYNWLNCYVKNRSVCSLLVVIVVVLIIGVPAGFLLNSFAKEAYSAYLEAKKLSYGGFEIKCNEGALCDFAVNIQKYISDPQIKYYFQQAGDRINKYLLEYGSNFILALPKWVVDIFIFLFFLYYLLKDGEKLSENIIRSLPLGRKNRERLVSTTKGTIYAILYGVFLTALIQGLVGGLGFWALGMDSPVFWGIVMAFFAMIPVGTGIVWVPASLYLVAIGLMNDQSALTIKGLLLFAYGLLIISTIDNLLRPKLISGKTKAHPLVVFTGIIGGIAMFGFFGIFIGPLILTLLIFIIELLKEANNAA